MRAHSQSGFTGLHYISTMLNIWPIEKTLVCMRIKIFSTHAQKNKKKCKKT